MTCSEITRGAEQWSRWSKTDRRTPLVSEESSRMSQHDVRLRPLITCCFVILALCLLLSDTFRLALSAKPSQVTDDSSQARNAQSINRVQHARIKNAKRHSGV